MHKKTILATVLFYFCATGFNAYASEALQRQLDAQQRTMLAMQNRMSEMEGEIKRLKGSIEELNYRLEHRSSAAEVQKGPAAENTQTAVTAPPLQDVSKSEQPSEGEIKDKTDNADAKAQELYDRAYALVLENKLRDAEAAFGSYLDTYKNSRLTPNAWYWKGQVQYKLKDYDSARVSFLNVVRFESSNKRPDALYKLGMVSQFKGDREKADKYFELVIKTYPNDTAATLAKRELAK